MPLLDAFFQSLMAGKMRTVVTGNTHEKTACEHFCGILSLRSTILYCSNLTFIIRFKESITENFFFTFHQCSDNLPLMKQFLYLPMSRGALTENHGLQMWYERFLCRDIE